MRKENAMRRSTWLVLCLLSLAAVGCAAGPAWRAREIAAMGGFDAPECVAVDGMSHAALVSNIATATQQYWADDGAGFISRLRSGGAPESMRWKDSTPQLPLNAPKGMCILEAHLYVADNTRVVCYPIATAEPGRAIDVPGARRLNDMASDGTAAYVSDTATGKIYRIDPKGDVKELKGPPGVNGITFFKGRMFAVSWDLHEVYELDPHGKADPTPFGVAANFKTPDGIEVLDDGTFVVSDFTAGRVATISPDRRTVGTILLTQTPADIGLDRERGILYVPRLQANQVGVYKLEKVEGK
jgi:DNA-binding beta-propeller fold protein YncE